MICSALQTHLIPAATREVPEEELEWEEASAFPGALALAWVYRSRWEFRAAGAEGHAPVDRHKGMSPLISSIPKTSFTSWMAAKELRSFVIPEQTNVTSKAERAKDGELLKLSLVGKGDSGQKQSKVQITEQWKLSEDGKSLKVDRTVKSPEGSGTVHLVFLKRESDATSAAAMLVKPY